MRTLLEEHSTLLGEEEIAGMRDAKYCKDVLGLSLSNLALLRDRDQGRMVGSQARYWKPVYAGKFFVCSQWWRHHHRANARALSEFVSALEQRRPEHAGSQTLLQYVEALKPYAAEGEADSTTAPAKRTPPARPTRRRAADSPALGSGGRRAMTDMKLFKLGNEAATELTGRATALERSLQLLMEKNLETMLGVRLLGSEYSTGASHGGRIDTLGIDENSSPVIIEYKRTVSENIINQGLFYLNWLVDHKADFELLVANKLGSDAPASINWTTPRLLCVASGFTHYDEHAVQQIKRSIELIRYRRFGEDLLMLEWVNASGV